MRHFIFGLVLVTLTGGCSVDPLVPRPSSGEPGKPASSEKEAAQITETTAREGLGPYNITFTKETRNDDRGQPTHIVKIHYPISPINPEESMNALRKYIAAAQGLVAKDMSEENTSKLNLAKNLLAQWEGTYTKEYYEKKARERQEEEARLKALAAMEERDRAKAVAVIKELQVIEKELNMGFKSEGTGPGTRVSFSAVPHLGTPARFSLMNRYFLQCGSFLDLGAGTLAQERTEITAKQQLVFKHGMNALHDATEGPTKAMLDVLTTKEALRAVSADLDFSEWDIALYSKEGKGNPASLIEKIRTLSDTLAPLAPLFPFEKLHSKEGLAEGEGPNFPYSDQPNLLNGNFSQALQEKAAQAQTLVAALEKETTKEGVLEKLIEFVANRQRDANGAQEYGLRRYGWKFSVDILHVEIDRQYQNAFLTDPRFNTDKGSFRNKSRELVLYNISSEKLVKLLKHSQREELQREATILAAKRELIKTLAEEILKEADGQDKYWVEALRKELDLK